MFSTAFTYMASAAGGDNLWTPAEITTSFWVDADDYATFTFNGSNVSQWNDKSGNGNNAVQSDSGLQPEYSATIFNGKPAVVLSASKGFNVTTGTFGPNISIFAVTEPSLEDGFRRLINVGYGVDTFGFFGARDGFATFFGDGAGGWNDISTNSPTVSILSKNILEVVNPTSGSNATPYVNGTAQNTKLGTMGTTTGLGIAGFSDQVWDGPVTEIIIANYAVSTTVREQIEGYLAWKWGLEANLPNDHPYKNSPPTV
jgi:hypothetical protein